LLLLLLLLLPLLLLPLPPLPRRGWRFGRLQRFSHRAGR
jgi:hypothetical protein